MKFDPFGFNYAIKGVLLSIRSERNMKFHLFATFIVIIFGFYYQINFIEWAFIVIAIGIVITTELINTAIEYLTNYLFKEQHETAKQIKDISAGAVLIASTCAAIIGLIIFIPHIIKGF